MKDATTGCETQSRTTNTGLLTGASIIGVAAGGVGGGSTSWREFGGGLPEVVGRVLIISKLLALAAALEPQVSFVSQQRLLCQRKGCRMQETGVIVGYHVFRSSDQILFEDPS